MTASAKPKASSSSTPASQRQKLLIIAGIVIIVVVAVAVVVLLSGRAAGSEINYADIPQSRAEDGGFVLGNPDAPITVVEFADFLCPHCQDYKPTMDRFIKEYVVTGKAKYEYRMLPAVDPVMSQYTARLAECADTLKPGSFWKAHDVLFELAASTRFTNATAQTFAQRLGLEYGALLVCTQDANQVTVDQRLATQMGVQGTPAVLIRNKDGQIGWIGGTASRGAPDYTTLQFVVETAQ